MNEALRAMVEACDFEETVAVDPGRPGRLRQKRLWPLWPELYVSPGRR